MVSGKLQLGISRHEGTYGNWQEIALDAELKQSLTKQLELKGKISGRSQEPTDVFHLVGPDADEIKEKGYTKTYKGSAEGKDRDQLKETKVIVTYTLNKNEKDLDGEGEIRKFQTTTHALSAEGGVIQPYANGLGEKVDLKAWKPPYKPASAEDGRGFGAGMSYAYERVEQKKGKDDQGEFKEKLSSKKTVEKAYLAVGIRNANPTGVEWMKETKKRETTTTNGFDIPSEERALAISLGAGWMFPVNDWNLDFKGYFNHNNLEDKGETSLVFSLGAHTQLFHKKPYELKLDLGVQYAQIQSNAKTDQGVEIGEALDMALFVGLTHATGKLILPKKYQGLLVVSAQAFVDRADVPGLFEFSTDGGAIPAEDSQTISLYERTFESGDERTFYTPGISFAVGGKWFENPDESGFYMAWDARYALSQTYLTDADRTRELDQSITGPVKKDLFLGLKTGMKW